MPPANLELTGTSFFSAGVPGPPARGCTLPAGDGTTYLDFTAGWGAALLGYAHEGLLAALREQLAGVFPQPAGLVNAPIWQTLADHLHPHLPPHLKRIQPCADGHTALRQAATLARVLTGRRQVIALHSSAIYLPGSRTLPFPAPQKPDESGDAIVVTLAAIQEVLAGAATAQDIAAVVVPAGLGPKAGCALLPSSFLAALQELCHRQGLLLILDERETGGGRTGRVFSALDDASPDMLVLGGPLMAGLPPGLLLLPEALAGDEWPGPAGGDALGAAAAVATLAALPAEGLLNNAAERGAQLIAGLQKLQAVYPFFNHIRGEGLFVGVEIGIPGRGPDADLAHRIQAACLDRGLILQVGGPDQNVIAWLPPLVVSEVEISTAIDTLDEAIEEIFED